MLHYKTELRDVAAVQDSLVKAIDKYGEGSPLEAQRLVQETKKLIRTSSVVAHEEINSLQKMIEGFKFGGVMSLTDIFDRKER